MFSRLEATRAQLERELGCDVFMKAYKTVQVLVLSVLRIQTYKTLRVLSVALVYTGLQSRIGTVSTFHINLQNCTRTLA